MDFLRSCTTNAHVIATDPIEYSLYHRINVPQQSEAIDNDRMDMDVAAPDDESLVDSFERDGFLVDTAQDGDHSSLWIFQLKKETDRKPDERYWTLKRQSHVAASAIPETIDSAEPVESSPDNAAVRHFHTAIASHVSRELNLIYDPVPIGWLTWILSPKSTGLSSNHSPAPGAVESFLLSVTIRSTPAGAVVCLPQLAHTTFQSLGANSSHDEGIEDSSHNTLFIFPLDLPASLVGRVPADDGGPWLSSASTWFKDRYPFIRSSKLSSSNDWLTLRLLPGLVSDGSHEDVDTPVNILWPACLCVHRTKEDGRHDSVMSPFTSTAYDLPNFEDPLRKAQEWFLAKAERDAALESQKVLDKPNNDLPPVADDFDSASSPVYLRVAESSATMVYPTPPDGLTHIPQRTGIAQGGVAGERIDEDEPMQSASQDNNNSDSHALVEGADDESDDLFGDMDEDVFGHPDVTDADFNFFDESAAAKTSLLRQLGRHPSKDNLESIDTNLAEHQGNIDVADEGTKPVTADADDSMPLIEEEHPVSSDAMMDVPAAIPDHDHAADAALNPGTNAVTPPLSPTIVKGRLFESYDSPRAADRNSQHRHFKALAFSNPVPDDKYTSGGKYSSRMVDTDGRSDLPALKRGISLREYLEQKHPRAKASLRNGVGRLAQNKLALQDSDDSDSDSTITSSQGHGRRVRPRLAIDDVTETNKQIDHGASAMTKWRRRLLSTLDQTQSLADPARDGAALSTLADCWGRLISSVMRDSLIRQPITFHASLWDLFDLDSQDLIEIAQLVTANRDFGFSGDAHDHEQIDCDGPSGMGGDHLTRSMTVLPKSKLLTLAGLATMSAVAPSSTALMAGRANPTPKRTISIAGSATFGQQLTPIHAPFVKFRRADAMWEMLSSATAFWEVLGLEPANGSKDVIFDAIVVGSDDFRDSCALFLQDLRYYYESCKLGQHTSGIRIHHKSPAAHLGSPNDSPVQSYLTAIKDAFMELSKKVNQRNRQHKSQPSIVYLFSPWRDTGMNKYLCACYRLFCKDLGSASNNVTLQIVSGEAVYRQDDVGVSKSQAMLHMALSVYDKISLDRKPTTDLAWQISSSPGIILANPIPKRLNFMINQTPPTNLLQEAQVLHLAYGISADGRWLVTAFTDYTGEHQATASFCLYKASYEKVLNKVKDYTKTLMPSGVGWRLIVGFIGHTSPIDRQTWLELAASHIAVSVVELCPSSPAQIYYHPDPAEPPPPAAPTPVIPQPSSLTPVSTPQPASILSPDAIPQTPGSADQVPTGTGPDPEAHLVDPSDESFCLVLPFSAVLPRRPSPRPAPKIFASGLLLKRGPGTPGAALPSLGVDIVGVAGPRTRDGQTPFLAPRPAEYVLREVLAWYRGLALLGKLRGVKGCDSGAVPWHVGVVTQSALALEGFFD